MKTNIKQNADGIKNTMEQIKENIPEGKHIAHAVNGEVRIAIKNDNI
jgi:hypothetical protein